MSARLLPEEASPFHEQPSSHVYPRFGREHLCKPWCWCRPVFANAEEYVAGLEWPLWVHYVEH